jgi:hypothetical protein
MVVVDDGDAVLQTGLPFDTVDALVVQTLRPEVLRLLLPYARCLKAVLGNTLCKSYRAAAAEPRRRLADLERLA